MSTEATVRGVRVAVLSPDPETLDGLSDYLRRLGAVPTCITHLGDWLPHKFDVAVLFGDDFAPQDVMRLMSTAPRTGEPRGLVYVTRGAEIAALARSQKPVRRCVTFLRRPVVGWVLVDAIRGCLDAAFPRP